MAELIDRTEIFFAEKPKGKKDYVEGFMDGAIAVLNKIDEMPTIKAKPVVHSYWHHMASGYNGMEDPFMCDNCCYTMEAENIMENHNALRHCSSCGARMDYVDTTAGKIKIGEEDEDG